MIKTKNETLFKMRLRHEPEILTSKLVNDSMYITSIHDEQKWFACSSCNYISDRLYHTRMHIERIHIKHGNPIENKRKYPKFSETVKSVNFKEMFSVKYDGNKNKNKNKNKKIENLLVFLDSSVLKSQSYVEKYQDLSISKNAMYVDRYQDYVVEENETSKNSISSFIVESVESSPGDIVESVESSPGDIEIFSFCNDLLGYNFKDRKNGLSGMYSYHV
jgi:hypothetical protein